MTKPLRPFASAIVYEARNELAQVRPQLVALDDGLIGANRKATGLPAQKFIFLFQKADVPILGAANSRVRSRLFAGEIGSRTKSTDFPRIDASVSRCVLFRVAGYAKQPPSKITKNKGLAGGRCRD
jgi:hypothetical protein